jgi:hypothetical protein
MVAAIGRRRSDLSQPRPHPTGLVRAFGCICRVDMLRDPYLVMGECASCTDLPTVNQRTMNCFRADPMKFAEAGALGRLDAGAAR